ncbi:MAG: hypothetical protein M3069_24460 [Chloroflexota bacterium]|nr:hypothetical protein [Chloroflexota bacterium]
MRVVLMVAGAGLALAYLSRRSGDGTVVAGYEGYQGRPMRVRNGLERTIGKAQTRLYDRARAAIQRRSVD